MQARLPIAGPIAMTDTPSPLPLPEPTGELSSPAPAQGASAPVEVAPAPSSASASTIPAGGRGASRRRLLWAFVALACVAGGIVVSLLRAQSIAHTDAANTRRALRQSSTQIATTLKLAIQHEEDLALGASTYFAGKPNATAAEFQRWAKWTRTLSRYPELNRLGLVTIVRAPQLAAYATRVAQLGTTPLGALPSTTADEFQLTPAGTRPYYCLSAAELARGAGDYAPAGLDYCASSSALLLARDAGRSASAPVGAGKSTAVEILTPVYRGPAPPTTQAARMGAFAGWINEVLLPGVMLEDALRGHADAAVRLRFRTSSSDVIFSSGHPAANWPSETASFHNDFALRTFGPPPVSGVLADDDALALLIVGCLLSALLGLLVYALGAGRPPLAAKLAHDSQEDLYDTLTGLPNHALMLDRTERTLARASREPELLVGVLFVNIDWLTDVNTRLGEAAGDQLLKIVAERLEGVIREQDTVGRLGGDEFVVLVETAARGARLDSLARRMIDALHKPVALENFGPSFHMTASIGVAFGRYEKADELLRDARAALNSAKASGKDRYAMFNANMHSVQEGDGVIEVDLNAALANQQFFLLYQPIYDLSTQKIVGLEALIRWRHPKQGVLLPAEFIPLAEETGLIVPIGRGVLEEACRRAAAWNVAGHRIGVSVEVAAAQLNRDGFATDVRRALQQSGVEPSQLTLEITEATVMADTAATAARLAEIKQLGVSIAIDNFGTGYAYHSDLQRLPLDFLKVDRSSLAASDDEDYRSWLLEAILVLGRDLSLRVIAKGVETREQLTSLKAMGCTMAQGYYLSKPVPASAVASLLDADFPAEAPAAEASSAPADEQAPAVETQPAEAPALVEAPSSAPAQTPPELEPSAVAVEAGVPSGETQIAAPAPPVA
jgi:diguanylate cyclase (GGDEF)-like protein